jgi:hypothetical protein
LKDNLKYVGKVAMIHIATYILCGMVFSIVFNYEKLYTIEGVKNFMRPFNGTSTMIGPLIQVVRGSLFGIILLLTKDFFTSKYGWLKLWILIVVVGIVNTPAPAPFSIEGMVYTQLPLEFQLKGAPEILIQTLIFSYFAARPKRQRAKNKFIEDNKVPLIISIIGGIGISLSGIVLTLLLKLDIMAGARDFGAFIIMFAAMLIVFLSTKLCYTKLTKAKTIILAFVYYIAVAIMPTVYNFIVSSPFKSLISLAINVVPVALMLTYLYFSVQNPVITANQDIRN